MEAEGKNSQHYNSLVLLLLRPSLRDLFLCEALILIGRPSGT
jgi:hypothetical protein